MQVMKIKGGNILYFEDTVADYIYVIRSGKLYLRKAHEEYYYKHNELNSKIILGPGDMFGFREIFLNIKREARAVAIDETEILIFSVDEFSEFLKKNVKIGKKVLSSLSTDIRGTSNRIKKLSDEQNNLADSDRCLYEIYLYFLKQNELSTARQVLKRMKLTETESFFAKEEEKRIEEFEEFEAVEINEESLKSAKQVYKDYPEILEYFLVGLKQSVMEAEVMENLLHEIILLKKERGKLKKDHEELEEFVRSYPNSPYSKDMMFLLLEIYHSRKEFMKAFQISQLLSEAELTDEEKERFKEMVNFLKKVIARKGGH